MDKLQQYAEAIRSGKYSQSGTAYIEEPKIKETFVEPNVKYVIPNYEEPKTSKMQIAWSILNGAISVALIILLIYLFKFADRSDIEKVKEKINSIPLTENEIKVAFLNWAYSPDTGIGLNCKALTRHNNNIFLLKNCVFTEGNKVLGERVILGREIKPYLPIGGEYANTQP